MEAEDEETTMLLTRAPRPTNHIIGLENTERSTWAYA